MTPAQALTAGHVLAIAAISGACGGLVFVLSNIKVKGAQILFFEDGIVFWPMAFYTVCSVASGAGSGVGLLFVLHFLQLLKTDDMTDNTLFLTSACLIAGIAAQRLIPRYTSALEEKVESIARLNRQTRDIAEENSLITKAEAALRADAPATEKLKVADLIRRRLQATPMDRELTIYLGRLLRHSGQMDQALKELQEFSDRKAARDELDKDYADVLYNQACYHAVQAASNRPGDHLTKCLSCLRNSALVLPSNKRDARGDPDFEPFWGHPDFVTITTPPP